MGIQNFPLALQPIIQQGFLEREFQQALNSRLGYRACADREMFAVGIGETLTKTRAGLKPSVTTPLSPDSSFVSDAAAIFHGRPSMGFFARLVFLCDFFLWLFLFFFFIAAAAAPARATRAPRPPSPARRPADPMARTRQARANPLRDRGGANRAPSTSSAFTAFTA